MDKRIKKSFNFFKQLKDIVDSENIEHYGLYINEKEFSLCCLTAKIAFNDLKKENTY